MNPGHDTRAVAAALLTCWLGAALTAFAPPLRRGPPIQFSEPANPALTTNLNTLSARKPSTLQKLEEDLRQPFRMLDRDNASGSERMLARPPAGPVIQSPKVRELLDRQKNWVFVKPEEQLVTPKDSRVLELPESDEPGRSKDKPTLVEQYFEMLLQREAGLTNGAGDVSRDSADTDVWGGRREPNDPARAATSAELREKEGSLRQFFDAESQVLPNLNQDTALRSDLFDTKGANSYQTRAREMRMEQFKQTLPVEPPRASLSPSPALPSSAGAGLSGLLNSPRSMPSPAPPAVRSAPLPTSGAFSAPGIATTPSLSGALTPALPATEPVRKPAPSPFTEIPKRRF